MEPNHIRICSKCGMIVGGRTEFEAESNLERHIQQVHEAPYVRSDGWFTCKACNGSGKDYNGLICPICRGSKVVS